MIIKLYMLYRINELKVGHKVIINQTPCIIIENECVKPGKGQVFNRVRFKQIMFGKILEKTLKSGECLEIAYIKEVKLIYLYHDDKLEVFMNEKNFDQIGIHYKIMGNSIKWLQEQFTYLITFWNDNPILVNPPLYMHLKVIKTTSNIKNVSLSSGNKLATVSTGAVIKVPHFIQIGELVKINTHTGTYISRIKSNST